MVVRTEDVKELKSVLERVEGKLIAAEKTYSAMNFAYWLFVMALFYVITEAVRAPGLFYTLYWIAALIAGFTISGKVFHELLNLHLASGRKVCRFPWWRLAVPWVTGVIVGFSVVPHLVGGESAPAIGLLSCLAIALFGQWALVTQDFESIPAFIIPAVAVWPAMRMGTGAMSWAGFAITTGFALTVLLYLYSAFRAIKR